MTGRVTGARRRAAWTAGVAAAIAMLAACGGGGGSAKTSATDASGRLVELTPVTVTSAAKFVSVAPVLTEDTYGEFRKQNIDLSWKQMTSSDALVLLAQGKVDAVFTGMSAGLLNAVQGGADIKVVVPGEFAPADSRNGWWVSRKALGGKEFRPQLVKGRTLASSQGATGASVIGLDQMLRKAGLNLTDVTFKTLASTDIVTALENGAVFGGAVTQPLNVPLEKADSAFMVAPVTIDGFPNTVLLAGPSLLRDPAKARAFVRGFLATTRNHYQGDFVHDPSRGPVLAKALGLTEEQLRDIPSGIWPTEPAFPPDYVRSYERLWRQVPDTLSYQGGVDPSKVLDDSLLTSAG